MKNFILAFCMILISGSIMAQSYGATSGGPDTYGYTFRTSDHPTNPPSFRWHDITNIGTLVTGLGDDNYVGPINGYTGANYYWYSPNQFYIGSNGFISFNGVNIASPFPSSIPNPLGPSDFIAPHNADLNFAGTGNPAQCYYYATTDSLVVSFINVPYWSSVGGYTGSNTFQVCINKADHSISFNYLSMSLGTYTSTDCITGIENVTGSVGLMSFRDSVPHDSLTIRFDYPASTTFQVKDASMEWNDNDQNGGFFVKEGGSPRALWANVKNSGNQNLSNFTVYDTVYNSSGNAVTNGSVSIAFLAPGMDTTVMLSDSFSAPNSGVYIFRTHVSVPGDIVGFNNINDVEVVSVDTTGLQMALEYTTGNNNAGGLGWNGGGGGIAIYYEPPFYPAKLKDTRFYITAAGSGFSSVLYDDDGPNGGPGTVLDSVFVGSGSINANNYKYVNPSQQVIIDSGGVYLFWSMNGAGVNLGRTNDLPISRRTYEVLGGSWSGYRDNLTEDFLMGIRVRFAYPTARFDMDLTSNPVIGFTDKSTNSPTSWLWDFGDGNTDTVQNPSHNYLLNDTFTVCLTAYNQYGSDSICKKIIIDGNVPTADFTYDLAGWPLVTFSDQSTNDPTAWHWDFNVGPGDTAVAQNTAFNYKANGTYNVCLIASNKNGPSIPACKDVSITGLGFAELIGGSVNVFPNPMKDMATLTFSEEFQSYQLDIRLVNVLGKEVPVRIERNGSSYNIYKDELPAGLYIIDISTSDESVTKIPLQVSE